MLQALICLLITLETSKLVIEKQLVHRVRDSLQTTIEPLVPSLVQGLMQMIRGDEINFTQIAICLWEKV